MRRLVISADASAISLLRVFHQERDKIGTTRPWHHGNGRKLRGDRFHVFAFPIVRDDYYPFDQRLEKAAKPRQLLTSILAPGQHHQLPLKISQDPDARKMVEIVFDLPSFDVDPPVRYDRLDVFRQLVTKSPHDLGLSSGPSKNLLKHLVLSAGRSPGEALHLVPLPRPLLAPGSFIAFAPSTSSG
jgi:hypothetical protein